MRQDRHELPDNSHLRGLFSFDPDRRVVGIQREELNALVGPTILADGFAGGVFFDREASSIFRIAERVELYQQDATVPGAYRAGTEQTP